MHLVAPLASGFANAPLGTATLTLRGTATPAPYYTDFEGSAAGSTGVPVALNSFGQVAIYVPSLTTVVVKNAAGVTVATFTAGDAAPSIEIRSDSFTGNPYTGGGGAAAGLPTTLQAVADLWLTQNGSIDWKVLVNGVAYTIAEALSSAALGIVFNVKSTLYAGGATGNGATDDYAAVAATVAACSAAGGGIVWFPPGTYRLNSPLTIPDKVTLLGAGPGASNITFGHSGADGIELLTGTVGQQVFGLKMSHATAASRRLLRITATIANIADCEFDGGSATSSTLVGTASASALRINIDNCRFLPANTRAAIDTSAASAANTQANITRCYVRCPVTNASQDLFKVYGGVYTGCIIDFAAATGGTPRGIDGSNGGIVTGCRFKDAALGVVWYGLRCPEDGTGFSFCENSNEFGQGTDPLNGHAYDFLATEALLGSRDTRWIEITESVASGNITLLMKEFGRCEHYNSSTSSSNNTIVADSLGPKHAACDVILHKPASGGTSTQTFSNTWFVDSLSSANISMASSGLSVYGVRCMNSGHSGIGANRWVMLSAVVRSK